MKSCFSTEYERQGSEFYTLQKKARAFTFKESGVNFQSYAFTKSWGEH